MNHCNFLYHNNVQDYIILKLLNIHNNFQTRLLIYNQHKYYFLLYQHNSKYLLNNLQKMLNNNFLSKNLNYNNLNFHYLLFLLMVKELLVKVHKIVQKLFLKNQYLFNNLEDSIYLNPIFFHHKQYKGYLV